MLSTAPLPPPVAVIEMAGECCAIKETTLLPVKSDHDQELLSIEKEILEPKMVGVNVKACDVFLGTTVPLEMLGVVFKSAGVVV
jgi:hypothetical protein